MEHTTPTALPSLPTGYLHIPTPAPCMESAALRPRAAPRPHYALFFVLMQMVPSEGGVIWGL